MHLFGRLLENIEDCLFDGWGSGDARVAKAEVENVIGSYFGLARQPVGKKLADGGRFVAQFEHALVYHGSLDSAIARLGRRCDMSYDLHIIVLCLASV